ncbi:hypothetical protein ACLQ3C_15135 [Gordonia sp. DT30]|uniref:hypothetical protein n=1 Tax=unclassified Gordonia (in: high G+C Gram-positive bacteria) TaxID=2657482 RepID=UPI003CF42619
MRTFLSAVATLIAMAAIVVALSSMWVSERVVDEDGFVDVVAPLAHDADVQSFISDEITEQVSSRVSFPGAATLIKPVAKRYTQGPDFPGDFTDLVRQEHGWLFDPAPAGAEQEMQLDITDMVKRALTNADLPFTPSLGTTHIEVPMAQGSGLAAGRYHKVGQQITWIAYGATALAVIAGLLALVVARRRGTVLAWLGVGALLAALAAWVAALAAPTIINHQFTDHSSGNALTRAATDALANDLTWWAIIAAVAGAIVVVVGVIVRIAAR